MCTKDNEYGNIEQLLIDLDLGAMKVSYKDILHYIPQIPDPRYQIMLVEHYLNGKTVTQVARENAFYVENHYSLKKSAIGNLRRIIINDLTPLSERKVGELVNSYVLCQLKIDKTTPIDDVITLITETDYRPSSYMDELINTLQDAGIKFEYPEFLKSHPKYPANLFADYLENGTIRSKLTVTELWNLYTKQLDYDPDYTYENFSDRAKLIYDPYVGILSEDERFAVLQYYVNQRSTEDIASDYGLSTTRLKNNLYNVIKTLNKRYVQEFLFKGVSAFADKIA